MQELRKGAKLPETKGHLVRCWRALAACMMPLSCRLGRVRSIGDASLASCAASARDGAQIHERAPSRPPAHAGPLPACQHASPAL